MLISVSNGLASGVFSKSILNNAMIESYAIHSRNLIDFLWAEKPTNDHIVAQDAHLSYDRIKVKKGEKPWDFILITKLISEEINQFLKLINGV